MPAKARRSIRTLLIHSAFASPDQPGGTRHYEFAQRLIAHGHRFAVVTGDVNYTTGSQVGHKGFITYQSEGGIDLYRSYTYKALHRSFVWRVIAFLSFAATSVLAAFRAGPADIIMGTTPPIFQAASACFVAFCRRRPFLLEVRDLWPSFAIDMGILTNPKLIAMSRWLERTLYRRATHLLVNSPAYRDYLISRGVAPDKITLVANGVDPSMFCPTDTGDQTRRRFALENKFVVTYAGALGAANDIGTILKAAAELRDQAQIHFLLVGDGKERARLEQQMRELGLNNVTFAGAQPKALMREFLAASNACVATLQNIPMFSTTYPNKVFDYMAAGRPTLLGIDGVIRELIERAQGGIFIPPGNASALAAAVLKLSGNADLCREMGRRARQYVVEHFNRDVQAGAFLELIERIAGA